MSDVARSDRALRGLADLLSQQLQDAAAQGGGPHYRGGVLEEEDVVLVIRARGQEVEQNREYLLPAATLDEAARVLGALPQIRGDRR